VAQIVNGNYNNSNAWQTEAIERLHQLDTQAAEIQRLHQKADNTSMAMRFGIILVFACLAIIYFMNKRYRKLDDERRKFQQKNIELTELVMLLKNNVPNQGTNKDEDSIVSVHLDKSKTTDVSINTKIQSFEKEYSLQLFRKIERVVVEEKWFLKPDLVIEELAQALSSNVKEISRAINDIQGQRFTSYINGYRIELAKELLTKHPDLSIKELSFQCGFTNQPQFQRKFKEMTGTTPEQYRIISNPQNVHLSS
jgi:AraC-like DNA-binding protein